MKKGDDLVGGTVSKWNDAKGFGFIAPKSGGEVFFHISSFAQRGARPTLGLAVTFKLERDKQGQYRAIRVRPHNPKPNLNSVRHAVNAFFTSAGFLGIVWILTRLGFVAKALLWLYLGASLLSYLLYAWDKSAARHNQTRRPEATLHWVALIGGWPGALFAQQSLRHKTKKQAFRTVFWLTVAFNLAALGYLLTPYGNWLMSDINQFFR